MEFLLHSWPSKKRGIMIFLSFILVSQVFSQNYPIGHRTMNFIDTARNNRPVPVEIYYPAESAGNNTMVAAGTFPVIVFGHGFLMPYSAYAYFRDAMVPDGYFVVFPTTEGGLIPNHLDFGGDLAFLIVKMKAEGMVPASPFYQHVDSTSAVMGHSMGGGASFLGCKDNTVPTAMVTFAAAETNPSAIAAASEITIPNLVFAASEDCVTPPPTNQVPMYDSLASECKVYISITGGGHCYFANYNFQCSLGETGCQQNFTVTREQQHAVILDFTKPYLAHYLKKDTAAWSLFNDSLASSARITFQKSCTVVSEVPDHPANPAYSLSPNPAGDFLVIHTTTPPCGNLEIRLLDLSGRTILKAVFPERKADYPVNVASLPEGFYVVSIRSGKNDFFLKFLKK